MDRENMHSSVGQDGFSFSVEGTGGAKGGQVPPVKPAGQPAGTGQAMPSFPQHAQIMGPVIFEEQPDGTVVAVGCRVPGIDDLNLEFEAGGQIVSGIGPRAFQNCQNLQRVILPETLQSIGEMAFAGCARLHSLTLPGSIAKVGTLAFARCTSLTRVRIMRGLAALGPSCFQKCQRLERVDIPASVTSFGGGVFFGCSRKLCLYGAEGSPAEEYAKANGITFDSEDWKKDENLVLLENEDGTLRVGGARHSNVRRVEIPDEICGKEIVAIEDNAFFGSNALEQVVIGRRVKRIGSNAFMGCRHLSLVAFEYGVERIEESAFAGCDGLRQMVFPSGTGSIGRLAFFGCTQLSFVRMPAITKIEPMAFDGCSPTLRVYGGVPLD